jgi:hypothetical protein
MMNQEITSKDEMWYKLGCDFCKLKKYLSIIHSEILYNHFGKSHKLIKNFHTLYSKYFIYLASTLDDIICSDYSLKIHTLETIPSNPSIVGVFYNLYEINSSTQITYNEKLDGSGNNIVLYFTKPIKRKYDKKLTLEEKKFIDIFFENSKEYLENIEFLLHYDPLNNKNMHLVKNDLKKRIVNTKNYIIKIQQNLML